MKLSKLFSRKKKPNSHKQEHCESNEGLLGYLGLMDWFNGLPREMQDKIREYSGQGETLTKGVISCSSSNQRKFLWARALKAIYAKDFNSAIITAKQSLNAQGDWADQHFAYSVLIEAYESLGDLAEAKRYCLEEINQFEMIGPSLKKAMGGEFPPAMRCRDTFLDILTDDGDIEEIKKGIDLLIEKQLFTSSEGSELLERILLDIKEQAAIDALAEGNTEQAVKLVEAIIKEDQPRAARLYKFLGNHFLESGNKQGAFEYLRKALAADPTISGVKRNLNRLAKELGLKVDQNIEQAILILKQREATANEWWAKRDLANEYVKLKRYEDAWRLFNEAISLRIQNGDTCDTIYPHMAKMREKEKNYLDALLLYLLGYRELLRIGLDDPPKYVKQGIDRCLKKLGHPELNYAAMLRLVNWTLAKMGNRLEHGGTPE